MTSACDSLGMRVGQLHSGDRAHVVTRPARTRSRPIASSTATRSCMRVSRSMRAPSSATVHPAPRRSGQTTRYRSASIGAIARHCHQCCGKPCSITTGSPSPWPMTATCEASPGVSTVRCSNAGCLGQRRVHDDPALRGFGVYMMFLVRKYYVHSRASATEVSMPATKDRALEAAVELLGTDGVRALSHARVDERAGLPPGSTSNWFRTRRALLAGIVDWIAEQEARRLRPGRAARAADSRHDHRGNLRGAAPADGAARGSHPGALRALVGTRRRRRTPRSRCSHQRRRLRTSGRIGSSPRRASPTPCPPPAH